MGGAIKIQQNPPQGKVGARQEGTTLYSVSCFMTLSHVNTLYSKKKPENLNRFPEISFERIQWFKDM